PTTEYKFIPLLVFKKEILDQHPWGKKGIGRNIHCNGQQVRDFSSDVNLDLPLSLVSTRVYLGLSHLNAFKSLLL
ncbi:MAG: hypothetical protein ACTSRC_16720, partial [Candidatus Helarchaeota archaeon]